MHKRNESNSKEIIDKIAYVAGFLAILMTIPQVAKIWMDQSAAGVSLITWFSYLILALVWIAYGIIHKAKPILITYTGYAILDLIILIGILRFA